MEIIYWENEVEVKFQTWYSSLTDLKRTWDKYDANELYFIMFGEVA